MYMNQTPQSTELQNYKSLLGVKCFQQHKMVSQTSVLRMIVFLLIILKSCVQQNIQMYNDTKLLSRLEFGKTIRISQKDVQVGRKMTDV